jgi:hypothetical protein
MTKTEGLNEPEGRGDGPGSGMIYIVTQARFA